MHHSNLAVFLWRCNFVGVTRGNVSAAILLNPIDNLLPLELGFFSDLGHRNLRSSWPLLSNLNGASHILELICVCHRLSKVLVHDHFLPISLLDLLNLDVDLLLLLGLLDLQDHILKDRLQLFDSLIVKD